jgi:hypothetical protein
MKDKRREDILIISCCLCKLSSDWIFFPSALCNACNARSRSYSLIVVEEAVYSTLLSSIVSFAASDAKSALLAI